MEFATQHVERLFQKTGGDRYIWLVVIFLSIISMLAVYSSTGSLAFKYQSGDMEYYLIRQFGMIALGILLMYVAHKINYTFYSRIAQLLLLIAVPLLFITLIFGVEINDARRWLTIPVVNISFQTSDLAKLALIMYTARALAKNQGNIKDFKTGFLPVMLPVLIVCGLIAPSNLSTAAILFATCLLLMFIGRVNMKYIGIMALTGIALLALIIVIAEFTSLHVRVDTWASRLHDFFGHNAEQYQVQQAKIAIANGGIFGVGPGNSTQRNFLPSPYSDFIYAIIVEEYGLIGAISLVILYLFFLLRCIKLFVKCPGAFGAFLAVGLSFGLVVQALINMAVVVHLLPTTGVTLPFVSMGGTSLWFTSVAIGIILSVSRNVEEENEDEPATA
ncbi:MAG TPA: putative peptidoglycan glycosyltransferase FtsW [Chitinophagales bacterium]|nr:putative peptidoglycan glycosyltransferase FtsW [Chitinophagales bacterium]